MVEDDNNSTISPLLLQKEKCSIINEINQLAAGSRKITSVQREDYLTISRLLRYVVNTYYRLLLHMSVLNMQNAKKGRGKHAVNFIFRLQGCKLGFSGCQKSWFSGPTKKKTEKKTSFLQI